ncbi:MAG: class I SAM-dependent methyltransferase [Parachlamydiales bacterium]|nr:class I SAM-dependent methyltransferase [Parachlamydiales bacterium]
MQPHLILAKETWKQFLKKSDLAIDATCGNGHDTLFLAELCSVIGLDIQAAAIQNTAELLENHEKKAVLHRMSHEKIDELPLPHPPRLIVYNLGYLPKGDKKITTMTESTLNSVKKGLEILGPGGALSITCYPGHEEGAREEIALEEWAKSLPSDRWLVCHHKWLNRKGAPSWLWISAIT